MRAVVDCCARELLTSYGLRTLSPRDPGYIGRYAAMPWQRDAAYHMGTVWAWLLGSLRPGSLPGLRRRAAGAVVSRAHGAAPEERLLGHGQRDIRW